MSRMMITQLSVIVILLMSAASMTGCSSKDNDTQPVVPEIPSTHAGQNEKIDTSSEPREPIAIELNLSHAPKVGETVVLTIDINVNYLPEPPRDPSVQPTHLPPLEWPGSDIPIDPDNPPKPGELQPPRATASGTISKGPEETRTWEDIVASFPKRKTDNCRVWVEFMHNKTAGSWQESRQAIQVSSEKISLNEAIYWEGSLTEDDELTLNGSVAFPEEGIWKIIANVETPDYDHVWKSSLKLVTTADQAGIFGSESFRSSDLACVEDWGNFSNGKDNATDTYPLHVEIDMAKPPLLGEPVELTCGISSLKDVQDVTAQVIFSISNEQGGFTKIPMENLLVKGDANWEGDVGQDNPVQFSAVIQFFEEGDREIALQARGSIDSVIVASSDAMRLNVSKEKSWFAWAEHPYKKTREGPAYEYEPIAPREEESNNGL